MHHNLNDFILFLYVHIADSDEEYDPAEMQVIQSKMSLLYPEGTDFEKKLYVTIREYNSFDKSKLKELLVDSFKHFKESDIGKSELYNDLQEIIMADGIVRSSEKDALDLLKEIIDAVS